MSGAGYRTLALSFLRQHGNAALFPVNGKQPVQGCNWSQYVANGKGVYGTLAQWYDYATGYAVAPIDVPYPLAVLDLDDPSHAASRAIIALIGDTLTVEARGMHKYVRLPCRASEFGAPMAIHDGKREVLSVRSVGRYVVGAGSQHPSGIVYRITQSYQIAFLTRAQLEALRDILWTWNGGKPQTPNEPVSQPIAGTASAAKGALQPMQHSTARNALETARARYGAQGRRANPRVVAEILKRLEQWQGKPLRYRSNGTADLARNPMRHDDEHRSAYVSLYTGMVFDMGTGQRWTTAQTANFLGIRFSELGGLFDDRD